MSYNSTVGPKDSQTLNQKIADLSGATSGYVTTEQLTAYTPTSGFSTINGSSITSGGNISVGSTKIAIPSEINYSGGGQYVFQVTASTELSTYTEMYNAYSGANGYNALFEVYYPINRLNNIINMVVKCTGTHFDTEDNTLYLAFSYTGPCMSMADYNYAMVNIRVAISAPSEGLCGVMIDTVGETFDDFNFS